MPVITQTTHNPRYEQQYNLELLRQLGGLASTAAGIYGGIRKDARADKKDAAALARDDKIRKEKQDREDAKEKREGFKKILEEGLTSGNEQLIEEGLKGWLAGFETGEKPNPVTKQPNKPVSRNYLDVQSTVPATVNQPYRPTAINYLDIGRNNNLPEKLLLERSLYG